MPILALKVDWRHLRSIRQRAECCLPMKHTPNHKLLQRLQEIVLQDTGRILGTDALLKVESILNELPGRSNPSELGQEFLSREVTILLADLRGFTAIAGNYPAEVVIQLLNPCLVRMSEIIFRHQGTIDKFMGDSIMVLFGAPVGRADDVQRALACAVTMQQEMQVRNLEHKEKGMPELFMGIGINTGTVLAGTLGSEQYSEYTVIGDEVNLASRIEAFSLRGQVLISESTYQHCKSYVETSDAMAVHVKGKHQAVNLRELLAIPSLGLKVPRQEIRRSHRAEIDLPFQYHRIENGIVLPETYIGTIRDIGYYGVLIELDRTLPQYCEIKIDCHLPLIDFRAEDIYAKIVSHKSRGTQILMGVEFTSVPTETNTKIQLFVQLLIFTGASAYKKDPAANG